MIPPNDPTSERSSRPAGEALRGLIERVTFHNEESGFAVLKVQVKGHRDLVTVIGSLPVVSAGEWITAEGEWVFDREHGRQLKAVNVQTQPPDSIEGIEKYLASGMIKGIGPVYAQKLVAKFGRDVFDIIEKQSARLQEVDGIGRERRQRIKEAWAEQRQVREIMVFLHAHGISTSRAVRIYKTFGEDAIGRIRMDPYCLAREIRGIGFKSADAIAMTLGVEKESVLRVRAGLAH
ncbi:MAG: helix-hairpin-helix domain-containing protein, partial [Chthoniobacterales bacterium]